MIRRFRHKGLERLFLSGDTGGVSAQVGKVALAAAMATFASSAPQLGAWA